MSEFENAVWTLYAQNLRTDFEAFMSFNQNLRTGFDPFMSYVGE